MQPNLRQLSYFSYNYSIYTYYYSRRSFNIFTTTFLNYLPIYFLLNNKQVYAPYSVKYYYVAICKV